MPVKVQVPTSFALVRRMQQMRDAVRPGSRPIAVVQRDIRQIVEDDHKDKMLRGVDRYGVARAPLAASTKKRRKGTGPSLIPRGALSRFITHFQTSWETVNGVLVLVQRFVGIVDRKGRSFVQYHLTGTSKMPKRDVGGTTPKGWAQIIARHKKFAQDVLRGRV